MFAPMSTTERDLTRDRPAPALLGRPAPGVASAVSGALLVDDVPDATAAEVEFALANLRDSIAAMPDVLRAGVGIASRVVGGGLWGASMGRFGRMSAAARSPYAQRLASAGLPVMAEFTRLSRGLGLAGVYEHRTPEMLEELR
jgi:hypothetical protein